jgi:hypothetical protein
MNLAELYTAIGSPAGGKWVTLEQLPDDIDYDDPGDYE